MPYVQGLQGHGQGQRQLNIMGPPIARCFPSAVGFTNDRPAANDGDLPNRYVIPLKR